MSVEEILKAAKEQEAEILNQEIVTEELDKEAKEKIEKKDEFIDKTIEAKKNSAFQKRETGEKRRSFSSFSSSKEEKEEKKEEKTPMGYSYGYGYGYGYGQQSSTKKEEKTESKKKTEKVFKEASKRIEKEPVEDLFSRHAQTKKKPVSKTKDSFHKGMLEALLETTKMLINLLSED